MFSCGTEDIYPRQEGHLNTTNVPSIHGIAEVNVKKVIPVSNSLILELLISIGFRICTRCRKSLCSCHIFLNYVFRHFNDQIPVRLRNCKLFETCNIVGVLCRGLCPPALEDGGTYSSS